MANIRKSKTEPLETEIVSKKLIKEELNLCEFPFTALTYQKCFKPLTFSDTITINNQKVNRNWRISGDLEYGIPIAGDEEILMGLFYLARNGGYIDRDRNQIQFKISELLKPINWPRDKQYYDFVKYGSLFRLFGSNIEASEAFYDKNTRTAIGNVAFHIIDQFQIYERNKTGNINIDKHIWDMDFNQVSFGARLWESIRAGNIKTTDLDFYVGLSSPTAKRVYRYLDKFFNRNYAVKMDIKTFAHEHIGLSRNYSDAGQLKRKLSGSFEELIEKGFISEPRFEKNLIIIEPAPHQVSTGVAVPSLPVANACKITGESLVKRFLNRLGHIREPLKKELMQAQGLMGRHGENVVKIVDYCIDRATDLFSTKTSYFGGILVYEPAAIEYFNSLTRQEKARAAREEQERIQAQDNALESLEIEKAIELFDALSLDRQEELRRQAAEALPVKSRTPLCIKYKAIEIMKQEAGHGKDSDI